MNKKDLLSSLQREAIINSHSHHLHDRDHQSLNLEKVFPNSYVNWCHKPIPDGNSKDEIGQWLDSVRNRSYFVWLEKALMTLYGIEEHLDVETWDIFDEAIGKATVIKPGI